MRAFTQPCKINVSHENHTLDCKSRVIPKSGNTIKRYNSTLGRMLDEIKDVIS